MASHEDDEEQDRCRICFGGRDDGPLVRPCACRGSAKCVHSACLETWRRMGPRADAAYRCGECKDDFHDPLSLELLRERLQAERMNGQVNHLTRATLASELQTQGHCDEAELLDREQLQWGRETFGIRHPTTLLLINNLGALLQKKGDLVAAESLYSEALVVQRETLGNRHPNTLLGISSLGMLLLAKGDLAGAEQLLREALEGGRETLGDRHPTTLSCIHELGFLLEDKGDLAAAESLYREALQVQRETLGNWHRLTLDSISRLGGMLYRHTRDRLAAAEPLLREAHEGRRVTLGSQHPETLYSIKFHAGLLEEQQRELDHLAGRATLLQMKDDEPLLRKALEIYRETLGNRHPSTLIAINYLASLLREKGDLAAAKLLYLEVVKVQRQTLGVRHPPP